MNADVIGLLARRRTVRRYTDQEVPEEALAALLEAAFYAPSYLNRRPAHFLVIRNKEDQHRLGAILGVRPYVQEASAVILLIGDPELSTSWPIDLAAAAQNMLVAATAMDLGAAWVGNPYGAAWESREEEIRELYGIPDNLRVFGLLTIGYAAEKLPAHTRPESWNHLRVHYGNFSEFKPEWTDLHVDAMDRIEGIGPKIANLLQKAGILSYEALSQAKVEDLQQIIRQGGILGDPSTWPEQARLAAAQDWHSLDALQATLRSGRHA